MLFLCYNTLFKSCLRPSKYAYLIILYFFSMSIIFNYNSIMRKFFFRAGILHMVKQANYLLRSGESLFPGHRSVFCILCQDLFQVLPPGFLFNNKSKGGEVMIKVFHDTFIMFIYRMSISAGIPMIENMRFQWGWISSYVDWI